MHQCSSLNPVSQSLPAKAAKNKYVELTRSRFIVTNVECDEYGHLSFVTEQKEIINVVFSFENRTEQNRTEQNMVFISN